MKHKKAYIFKVSAQAYLIVGFLCFFGFGYCIFNVDYGTSETEIMVGKIVMVGLTLLTSLPLIWYGVSKCIFVYSNMLIFRNMLFQKDILLYDEIEYFEHKVSQNTLYIVGLEVGRKKIGYASIKDINRLLNVLEAHDIQKIADYRLSTHVETLDDEILYTNIDEIVSSFDKKRWRWMRLFFVFLLSCPAILYKYREMHLAIAIVFFVFFIITIIMFEVSLAKDKLVLNNYGACRYYSFKRPRAIPYKEIDFVKLQYSAGGGDVERNYVFYVNRKECFRIPANFTNINQIMNRLAREGITVVVSNRVYF